ncbi:MAG TPA: MFS transporter [Polyangiaceae bacterium]|nr:MFS transporter [Polyangiaceae bacterium]
MITSLDERAPRALKISVAEGVFHATMVGVAESYLGAFAVELGHRDHALALLVTIPLLVGSSAQLLASPLVSLLGSRKRLVVLGATMQALTHLAFAIIAWTETRSFAWLLGAKCTYWISGMLIAPPWGAWMASLISGARRERYFAWRSGAVHLALLLAFGAGGWMLWRAQALGKSALLTFGVLNTVAVIARGLSALGLALQPDPAATAPNRRYDWKQIAHAARTAEWRPALYIALLMFGAHLAVPFFTPYMLRTLELDYAHYAALLAVPIVTKVLVSPLLFHAATTLRMRGLLATATVLVALVAWLWSFATTFDDLLVAQLVSGIAWGAFEYASYQLLLNSARPALQVEFLSLANSVIGAAQLSGALVGAALLSSGGFSYDQVFLLSAIGRALPVGLVFLWIPLRAPIIRRLFWRVVSVRPSGGTLRRPILTGVAKPPPPPRESEPPRG